MQVCSTAFVVLGHAQAKALDYPDLPIAIVPHPFGILTRGKLRELAKDLVEEIARLACAGAASSGGAEHAVASQRAFKVEIAKDMDAINRLFRERRWTDGLPIVPPTSERVERMLRCAPRSADETVAAVAPGFRAATVERIAINAVMAGCDPEYLPVLIAAVEAMAAPELNLQGIQATTNPAAVWLIVNGPIIKRLNMNSDINCLGQGNWANATLGRALRLIQQNIGGALPGEMDRSTQGQPGKYVFCCAENEEQNPWEPLHVETGMKPSQSAVTVVGAEGTINMNTHSKDADDILRVFGEVMVRPPSNDYRYGGAPWLILGPEHAQILKAAGLSKAEVKRRLWEESKIPARRMTVIDMQRMQEERRAELGAILPDTILPVCPGPQDLGIIVSGGPGTHSVFVPSFGLTRSVTREVIWSS